MIPITKSLIDLLKSSLYINSSIISSYTNAICKYGGAEDAKGLFKLFMDAPLEYNRLLLLQPIMKHGDIQLAEELYDSCFYQKDLREDMPYEVLHALGYLGYIKCTETLVSLLTGDDWHLAKNACLGLLHLPCANYESQIKSIIDRSFGKSLFDEFVPALSYKISSSSIVPKLFEWGDRNASTDCNSGIILGIALFGSDYKYMIKNILWNQNWEAHGTGTGTRTWSYIAMQHVQLTFRELIQDIRKHQDADISLNDLSYRLDVLAEMLECKLSYHDKPVRFTLTNNESITDIYSDLFDWRNEDQDDSVIGFISNKLEEKELLNKYYHLRDKLEMEIQHNIELEHLVKFGEQ